MLVGNGFGLLHVPKCGGTSACATLGLGSRYPSHDGPWAHDTAGLDVYLLLREPLSWYLSFAAYASKEWRTHFGLSGDWAVDVRRLALGDSGSGKPCRASSAISGSDVRTCMTDRKMGFWSFAVLHASGVRQNANADELFSPMRALWLKNRDKDIDDLVQKYKVRRCPDKRNSTNHPSIMNVYSPELIALVRERDGEILRAVQKLPSGV
jgi:hypothetical protein